MTSGSGIRSQSCVPEVPPQFISPLPGGVAVDAKRAGGGADATLLERLGQVAQMLGQATQRFGHVEAAVGVCRLVPGSGPSPVLRERRFVLAGRGRLGRQGQGEGRVAPTLRLGCPGEVSGAVVENGLQEGGKATATVVVTAKASPDVGRQFLVNVLQVQARELPAAEQSQRLAANKLAHFGIEVARGVGGVGQDIALPGPRDEAQPVRWGTRRIGGLALAAHRDADRQAGHDHDLGDVPIAEAIDGLEQRDVTGLQFEVAEAHLTAWPGLAGGGEDAQR